MSKNPRKYYKVERRSETAKAWVSCLIAGESRDFCRGFVCGATIYYPCDAFRVVCENDDKVIMESGPNHRVKLN